MRLCSDYRSESPKSLGDIQVIIMRMTVLGQLMELAHVVLSLNLKLVDSVSVHSNIVKYYNLKN